MHVSFGSAVCHISPCFRLRQFHEFCEFRDDFTFYFVSVASEVAVVEWISYVVDDIAQEW